MTSQTARARWLLAVVASANRALAEGRRGMARAILKRALEVV